ncbi:hypothetical protein GQ53DRAFT_816530 [Thozetella sp. PMI_491]|nr:hypothetical protein GQ53DRAFT_816530 [Thozetella sp. PMI_491]
MERPAKRLRIEGTSPLTRAENEDELVLRPEEINQRRDPGYQAHMRTTWLKSRFESIFEKYGNPELSSDEIDLRTGEVVTDNGHIQQMGDRHVEDAVEALADDQDALILRGTRPKPPSNSSFLGIVPGISQTQLLLPPGPQVLSFPGSISQDLFGPRDPKWQVPELPALSFGKALDGCLSNVITRKVAFKRPLAIEDGDQSEGDDEVLLGHRTKAIHAAVKKQLVPPILAPKGTRPRGRPPKPKEHHAQAAMNDTNERPEHPQETSVGLGGHASAGLLSIRRPRGRPRKILVGESPCQELIPKTAQTAGTKQLVAVRSTKAELQPTGADLLSVISPEEASVEDSLQPSSGAEKVGGQTFRVELSRNAVSKDEYQLVPLEETPPPEEDIAPLPAVLNNSEIVGLDTDNVVDPSPPISRVEALSSLTAESASEDTRGSARGSGSATTADAISPSAKTTASKESAEATAKSVGYSRNVIDPAYEFSDEDETTVLLPKHRKQRGRATNLDALQSSNRARSLRTALSTPASTLEDAIGSGLADDEEALPHIGNSDKENMPSKKVPRNKMKRGVGTKDKGSRQVKPKEKALSTSVTGDSADAELALEQSVDKEIPLASSTAVIESSPNHSSADPCPAERANHTPPPNPASNIPKAGSSATRLITSSQNPITAIHHDGPETEAWVDVAAGEASPEDNLPRPSSPGAALFSAPGNTTPQDATPRTASLEIAADPEISAPGSQRRSIQRTYSTRTRTRPLPTTPIKKRPSKKATSAGSDRKPPSSTRTSLLSLVASEDEDELSMGLEAFTPSSRRSFLDTSTVLAPSPSAIRKSTLRTSLAARSSPQGQRNRRRPHGFHPHPSSARGSPSKQEGAGAGESAINTPVRRTIGPEPSEELYLTPGGTMRRCGEAGFRCDRDFCMTCD